MTAPKPPNPALLYEFLNAYQKSATLNAAIELDVFTAIGEGADDVPALAARCGASERGIRILCDGLAAWGFLTREGGSYGLTPDTAFFLDKQSPAYSGGVVEFLHHPRQLENFWELADTIRRGEIPADRPESFGEEDAFWVHFARAMQPMIAPAAEFLAEIAAQGAGATCRTLDVAAGHGLFGVAVAKRLPQAQVTALDWPGVLEVARETAATHGVADRHTLLPGSAFEVELGGPYDLVLVTNFFHHFSVETNVGLIRKIAAALAPGGRVVTLDFIPDEDRLNPSWSATFGLTMLANTNEGDVYTFSQYEAMFREAGFQTNRLIEAPAGPHRAVVSEI